MKFKHYIVDYKRVNEAAYDGNLGFEELVTFYKKADENEKNQMEKIIENDDWRGFKQLIYKVIGIKFK